MYLDVDGIFNILRLLDFLVGQLLLCVRMCGYTYEFRPWALLLEDLKQ